MSMAGTTSLAGEPSMSPAPMGTGPGGNNAETRPSAAHLLAVTQLVATAPAGEAGGDAEGAPMDVAKWLACTDAAGMWAPLQGRVSERKHRLFVCACCRLWHRRLPAAVLK